MSDVSYYLLIISCFCSFYEPYLAKKHHPLEKCIKLENVNY